MKVPFLDLPAQNTGLKKQLMEVASRAFDTASFIGGAEVSGLETEFAAYCGAAHCVGVSSGTSALRLALQALGVGKGDLVLTVPNTFIATTEAVSQVGATFDFVDVDPQDCLMDMNLLEERLKSMPARPKAVIPVHLYGQCADMRALKGLAARFEFHVVEDACQAHGASQEGVRAGCLADAGAFSFYPGKNLGACGEAGCVTTGDAELARTVAVLRDHGQGRKYHHDLEGTNARLDAMQAGFLRVKLPHLEGWNERRRAVARTYDQAFEGLAGVSPVVVRPGNVPSRHLYVLHVPDREGLRLHLASKDIGAGLHYPVPLHLQDCYRHLGYAQGSFPVSEQSSATLISLPVFGEITDEQVSYVIESVLEFLGAAK